jgi:hypothetical protein
MTYTIGSLVRGTSYYTRVSAITDKGLGGMLESVPLNLAPVTTPGVSSTALLAARTDSSLTFSYDEDADSGGSLVSKYKVEYDISPNFDSKYLTVKEEVVSSKTQKVTSFAGTAPLSGSFTLSYGSYMGDFTQLVGDSATTFKVNIGDSYLTVATGGQSMITSIARGEYIKVAGSIYRVATDMSMDFSATKIPLATAADPTTNTTFLGKRNYTNLPVYMPDTSLGCISVNVSSSQITTRWTGANAVNDIRDATPGFKISRGDLIRLGDPFTGEVFRISTDMSRGTHDTFMPLSTPEDPLIASSFDPADGIS